MHFVRPGGGRPVNRPGLKVIEASHAVRRAQFIRRRIAEETRLRAQLQILLPDGAMRLECAHARMPVNRSALEVAEPARAVVIAAHCLVARGIAEETLLPAQVGPLLPDEAMHLVRAGVGVPVNRAALEVAIVAFPVGADGDRSRRRLQEAARAAERLILGLDVSGGQFQRRAELEEQIAVAVGLQAGHRLDVNLLVGGQHVLVRKVHVHRGSGQGTGYGAIGEAAVERVGHGEFRDSKSRHR